MSFLQPTSRRRIILRIISFLLLFLLCAPLSHASIVLKDALKNQENMMGGAKKTIKELETEQKKVKKDISLLELQIAVTLQQVRRKEKDFENLQLKDKNLAEEIQELKNTQRKTSIELNELLQILWPIYNSNIYAQFKGEDNWKKYDRHFNSLKFIYTATEEKFLLIEQQAETAAKLLEEQKALTLKIEKEIQSKYSLYTKYLEQKLSHEKMLSTLNRKQKTLETELSSIIGTIATLKDKIKFLSEQKFAEHRKYLDWPVQGEVITKFDSKSKPPQRGLGIKTAKESPVSAVFRGKVVHNDTLRGYGRVVIIFHGEDYYSVYAFLNNSPLTNGQDVEKGDVIGSSGYYPLILSTGMYFEIRKHQTPLDPSLWLISKENIIE